MSNATKFSSYEFSGLDQLSAVAETVPLNQLPGAYRWSNSGDYRAICTCDQFLGETTWRIRGENGGKTQRGKFPECRVIRRERRRARRGWIEWEVFDVQVRESR